MTLPEKKWAPVALKIIYKYDGSTLFLRQSQMTRTPQNFIKNCIFMPQFLAGNLERPQVTSKGPQARSNPNIQGAQILVFLQV